MAFEYFLYDTNFNNTLVDRGDNTFAPLPPDTGEILINFLIPSTQPLYLYRESGSTIVLNDDATIEAYLNATNPPSEEDSVLQGEFTGYTATTDVTLEEKTEWSGDYTGGTYLRNTMVNDNGWTMVANKDTDDRAAPTAVGNPFNLYNVDEPPTSAQSAKQIVFGMQYDANDSYWINGYRVAVLAGNEYEIIIIRDAGGVNEVEFVNAFEADVTGWREFSIIPRPITSGTTYQLLAIVNEPDPTPITLTWNYDYKKPNNPATPAIGEIVQANKDLSSLLVNYTDDDLNDRETQLLNLTVGDQIEIGSQLWSIQLVTDSGSYVDFTVAPARQSALNGVQAVKFSTTTAANITYVDDANYWSGSTNIKGVFGVDTGWESAVINDSQYGIDMNIQFAYVSPDWDFMSTAGDAGGTSTNNAIWGTIEGEVTNQSDLTSYVTGETEVKIDKVTGATGNVGTFLADGNLQDSGYSIADLTGGTSGGTGATDIYVTGATLVGNVLNLERNGGLSNVTADFQAISDAITDNAVDIQLVSGVTTQNEIDIENNYDDITYISGETSDNTVDIQLVSGLTTQNSIDIQLVSGVTTQNESDIDDNASDIQLVSGVTTINTSDISDNTSDIQLVSGVTLQNQIDIGNNYDDITFISGETASNDADITYLSGQTDLKLNTSDFNIYSGATDSLIFTKIDKVTGATANHISTFVVGGNIVDSGKEFTVIVALSGATDNKVPTELAVRTAINDAVTGAVQLQGDWNAATNTPDLTVTGITTGYAWRVNVSGNTSLDGITDWDVGDLAIKTGTGWIKIDNTQVSTVWGNIGGTLSNQTDLQVELNSKVNVVDYNIYTATTENTLNGIESDIQLVSGVTTQNTSDINYISGVTDTKIAKVPTAIENNITLFDANGEVKDDGYSITAATESVKFQSVKGADQINTGAINAVVVWDTANPIDNSYYSFDNALGELTFTQDGWYDISYNASVKNVTGSNNRSQAVTWLQEDLASTGFTNINGTKAEYYVRQVNYGGAGSAELLKFYTTGQKIRMTIQRIVGTNTMTLLGDSTILKVTKSERSINTVKNNYFITGETAVVGENEFNIYSGITEARIVGIEDDIIFLSGASDQNATDIANNDADIAYLSGQTDTKLNISDFDVYSGVTDTLIDTKIDKVPTAVMNNLALFTADGQIYDSGVDIDSITGGTGFYFYEDRTATINNTTTTDVVYINGVSGSLTAGTWSLDFNALGGNTGNNKSIAIGFYIDGVLLGVENQLQANASTNVVPFSLTKDGILTAGVHTFEVRFRQSGGGTAFLEYASVRARIVN